jgi:hypothetical protein
MVQRYSRRRPALPVRRLSLCRAAACCSGPTKRGPRRARQAAVDGLPEVAEAQAQTLEGELAELRCDVQTLAEHAAGRGAMEARPCFYS